MIGVHVISVQANLCAVQVKPHCGGRSQNYMPPEAKDAIEKAQQADVGRAVLETPETPKPVTQ